MGQINRRRDDPNAIARELRDIKNRLAKLERIVSANSLVAAPRPASKPRAKRRDET